MLEEGLETATIDTNLEDQNEEYGFVVEDWDEDEEETPMEIPNTVFDMQTPVDFFNKERSDFGLSIMSGIAENGVKPLVDAVTALTYGATNLVTKGKFEMPTAKEMEEDTTILPKSLVHYEPQTTAGGIAKPLAGAAYGMAATTTGLGAVGLTGKAGIITNATLKGITKSKEGVAVGKILAPIVNGIAANGLAFWEDEGNLFNALQPHIKNPTIKAIVDYMSIEEDDTLAERAMKQSIAGGFIGGAAMGLGGIFKGLKSGYKYIKGKKAISSQSEVQLAEQLRRPIMEEAKKAEQVSNAVSEGKMIEPRKETLEFGEQTTKINPSITKEVMDEVNTTKRELGIGQEQIAIPRNAKHIDIQEAKNRVAMELSGDIDIDNPEDLKRLGDFVENSKNTVEKTMGELKAQEDTFIGGWIKLKEMTKNAEASGTVLSNAEKTSAMVDYFSKAAKARGRVEDVLSEGATAMGVSSKNNVHRANKAMLEGLEANLDEIATPELFNIFESAQTEAELISKINSFFANASEAVSKKGFDAKKFVALEQAGLMSATDTIIRNGVTSLENLTLGVVDDVAESLLNSVSTSAVRNGANAREFVDVAAKGAAYLNFLKDSAVWGLQRARRILDKSVKKTQSPWAKYRESTSRHLTTNLPKEVGHTFDNEGNLGKVMNSYIKISGVGISEGTDNFFEAGFFRGAAAQRVNAQARRLKKMYNITDEQAQKIGKTMLDNITNVDTSRRAYDIAEINEAILAGIEKSISKKAVEDATVMTFRSGQGMLTKGITNAVNKIPVVKIAIPFVKTSSTIVFDRFIYDRTPYGLLYEGGKSILSYFSPNIKSQLTNPALRNKFLAKQAVGSSLLGLGAYMYINGQITGDYPEDAEQRKMWQAAGIQPNSLVLTAKDGSKKYVSLNNLGVMSMLLKYPAKIAQYYNDFATKTAKQEKIDESEIAFLSNAFGASIMLGGAIAEETVLRNVAGFFDRLNRGFSDRQDMENFAINVATNPAKNIVPRIFRQMLGNKDFEEIVENNYESLKQTFSGLPVKHDVFGDEIERADFATSMAGFSLKSLPKKERFKGIMAKNELTVPGVQKTEFPTKGHSVRLDVNQIDKVYVKMKELGVRDAIEDIVLDMPKELSQPERDFYQKQIDRVYNSFKKEALMSLLLDDSDIAENYNQRLDFDMNEGYNINKPASVIPSLADF